MAGGPQGICLLMASKIDVIASSPERSLREGVPVEFVEPITVIVLEIERSVLYRKFLL